MKKVLIVSAVSAAFAAPAMALAQAVPTLDKVLGASGISMSGYIDTAYSYANKNIGSAGGFSDRVFDSQNNSFALHQFGLTVSKTPKEGFGGLVNLTVGSDAQVIHSFPEISGGVPGGSMFDVTQAYAQYASGRMTVKAGKFTTLAGTEVISSADNTTFSRSILFGAAPFTHTGVRASYDATDTITLYGGLNNGSDQTTDGNRGKTLELGATFTPAKRMSITVSDYHGDESATPTGGQTGVGPQGMRNTFDVVANFVISDPLSVGLEFLSVSQESTAVGTAKYQGLAGYVTYMIKPQWRTVLRAELFNDKDNFHFASAAVTPGTEVKYTELTWDLSYLPTSNVELRGEVRADRADTSVFIDTNGSTSKSLLSFALQGIYKF